ncbi:hypothetical protein L1049_023762 [Liquidambar formosana]|uniref:Phytocyanin domain-containing protein n=1 Tax=Liquidambar formosana TaxID=63359 RepID=A0AAP0RTW8_LIQFO
MESRISLSFLVLVLMGFLCSTQAYKFFVGGKDGWKLNPSENFNHWAERNRFQVNDTLFFNYNKGSDSVLVVTKDDYYKCNTKNPIKALTDGDSVFEFNRSGPFFFISGNAGSCEKDQKLIIVVLAVRNKTHQTPPPVTTPPSSSPPVPLTPASLEPSYSPADLNAPAPAPKPSSSPAFSCPAALVWGISIGVSVVLGSFVKLF